MQKPSGTKFLVLKETLEEQTVVNTDLKLHVVSSEHSEHPVTAPHR